MAQNNKSWKELMALQNAAGATNQQRANAMLDLIEGRKPFTYDAAADPTAQAVRKQTARNIDRTTRDTMGSYAAMTGGVPSSAAAAAAAQAGNYAGAQCADRVAELEQLARQNYQNEGQQMQSYWAMLQGQADSDYQREQAAKDREIEMAKLAALYGDNSKLKELGINVSTGGGSGGYSSSAYRNPTEQQDTDPEQDPVGLSDDDKSELGFLKMIGDKGYDSLWNQLAAQHGADALIAAGFPRPDTGVNKKDVVVDGNRKKFKAVTGEIYD